MNEINEVQWPSDETLELSAMAADDWKKHGCKLCFVCIHNEDGFR